MGGYFSEEKPRDDDDDDVRPARMPKKRGKPKGIRNDEDETVNDIERSDRKDNTKKQRGNHNEDPSKKNTGEPLLLAINDTDDLILVEKTLFISELMENVIIPYNESTMDLQYGSVLLYNKETKDILMLIGRDEVQHCTNWYFVGFNEDSSENATKTVYVTCTKQPQNIIPTLKKNLISHMKTFISDTMDAQELISKAEYKSKNFPERVLQNLLDNKDTIQYQNQIKIAFRNLKD